MSEFYNIHWKQQHLNNSCAWACLAMLFSRWGIQTEDHKLIAKSLLPYFLHHHVDRDDDWISAGIGCQSIDDFNLVSAPYGMHCIEYRLSSWEDYLHIATTLLQQQTPFLTGISAKTIPTPAYEELRRTNKPDHGHTIVMFRHTDGSWYGLDPSADLDRNREYMFANITDRVTVAMSNETFRTGILQKPGNRFLLLYTEPGLCKALPTISAYLSQSRTALSVFQEKMQEFLAHLGALTSSSPYVFNDYLFRYIKPIVLHFRVALDVVTPKTPGQQHLIQILQEFQSHMLTIQAYFRKPYSTQFDNLPHISHLTHDIVELIKQHLDQCPLTDLQTITPGEGGRS